jgi:hypothetical protein
VLARLIQYICSINKDELFGAIVIALCVGAVFLLALQLTCTPMNIGAQPCEQCRCIKHKTVKVNKMEYNSRTKAYALRVFKNYVCMKTKCENVCSGTKYYK